MANHVIISAYFGDYEFDVGATVRWHKYFFNTVYARDVVLDTKSRNHLLAWDASFGDVKFSYSSKPFFDPQGTNDASYAADWRRKSFLKADLSWKYGPDDWVFFLDGTECLTFDTQTGAPDPERFLLDGPVPLAAWVDQVVAAVPSGQDVVSFPFWAYTRSSAPWHGVNIVDPALEETLDGLGESGSLNGVPVPALRAMNRSYHQFNYNYFVKGGYLPRAFRASSLRSPEFDWTVLDTFTDDADALPLGVSVVSYAYAKYAPREDYDPATGYPAAYNLRPLINRVRPIDGLPDDFDDTAEEYVAALPVDRATGDPYVPPPGVVWDGGPHVAAPEFSSAFSADLASFDRTLVEVPGPEHEWPDASEYQLDTTCYGSGPFRQKVWAGLTYLSVAAGGSVSPVPWNFVAGRPALDPATWAANQQNPVPWTP